MSTPAATVVSDAYVGGAAGATPPGAGAAAAAAVSSAAVRARPECMPGWAAWASRMYAVASFLTPGWTTDVDHDRRMLTISLGIVGIYILKVFSAVPWDEQLQLGVAYTVNILNTGVALLAPRAVYLRLSPLLRLCSLLLTHSLPVWSSIDAFNAVQPSPSQGRLGVLMDSYWLLTSTRVLHLIWLAAHKNPPLYAALPLQLWGLWRIRGTDMCSAAIMQFPVIQGRTEAVHQVLSLLASGLGATFWISKLVPATPHQQCQALLLFSHLLLGVLLPLVMITPPAEPGRGAPVHPTASDPASSAGAGSGSPFNTACASGKALAAVEGRLRGWLRPFKWPAQRWQRGGPGAQAAFAARGWCEVVQRWLATTVVLWAVCCALYGGKE